MLHPLLMCQSKKRVDLSTPVRWLTVTNYNNYYTCPLMRLNNGWFVQAILENVSTYHIRFYVSKDNCATWTELCYIEIASTINVNFRFTTVSRGTKVYCVFQGGDSYDVRQEFVKFDAATVSDINIFSTRKSLMVGQRGAQCPSIAISPTGVLTVAWALYTNAQYYDAFTVKSTDDGATWTKHDGTAGIDMLTVSSTTCMAMEVYAVYSGETSIIGMILRNPMDYYNQWVRIFRYSGSWAYTEIYTNQGSNSNYVQMMYMYVQTRGAHAGRIWAFWEYAANLYYRYSDDGGVTFSSQATLVFDYIGSRQFGYYTVMAENSKGELWIVYTGQYLPSAQWYYGIFMRKYVNNAWGGEMLYVPTVYGGSPLPAICTDVDFDEPLIAYSSYNSPTGDFVRGIFYV